ncbi:ParB/RepB/Spo0J family partition protein [Meridianimarinicoccus aquatilis]|uniref:ParB/RepB/Spo0J family partition protein n=1 Tax=Meridianimarinicoccus aquatilis TaxID=2552766 RepID=A0A4R6AZT7_9RHOB|nr:ParB/RepB/Spo0J family partition protein [Fluviibacterium aquatile]QIE41012.1 ParB/RepB/Spo0J family partition protein [Rhodobacteraceae bacterium SC52]TDL89314.1 ParB/RepB/Spo0J family partition protein [Fluviibacterium aquatile]
MNREKRGLGRGLSALMADVAVPDQTGVGRPTGERRLPIEQIKPNPDQPRRRFQESDLTDLANSIREKGVIQPLIVRPTPGQEDVFQIVAGERRWRAAQMAQLHELPVLVREMDDTEVLEIAIIENIQRADLNPVEEAAGYRQLMDRFGHTQERLAEALGKSRSHIANLLRLLNLPTEVQSMMIEGRLSAGHARALITTDDPLKLARVVVEKGLSVRETEKLTKTESPDPRKTAKRHTSDGGEKDADTRVLEQDLTANLGMKVSVNHKDGKESGTITISYKSLDQLDELCRVLSLTPTAGTI